jgi:hypothetical protein
MPDQGGSAKTNDMTAAVLERVDLAEPASHLRT